MLHLSWFICLKTEALKQQFVIIRVYVLEQETSYSLNNKSDTMR